MKALLGLFGLILAFSFQSCYSGRPLIEAPSQNNKTYEVSYLFEHDGCKVYRFYDRGNCVYFTNCKGNITAINTDSTKNTVQTVIDADLTLK